MLLIPFILNAEEIMTQEGTEADEVTGQQRETQDDEGDGKNHPELYELTVEGF
jgi:hypothetical protein